MKFIEVTAPSGLRHLINVDLLLEVGELKKDDAKGRPASRAVLSLSNRYGVITTKESYDAVKALVKATKGAS